MYSSYIAHPSESHQIDDFDLMGMVVGVSIHFPQCFRRRRSELAFGQSSSCHIQLAWPSVVCCGLQNLGLSQHATLPILLPGLDKLGALPYFSPVLTSLRRPLTPLVYGARRPRSAQIDARVLPACGPVR